MDETGIAQLLNRATAAFRQGEMDRALALSAELLTHAPDHAEGLSLAAVLAIRQSNLDRALRLLDRALQIDPRNVLALGNRGVALHAQGRLDEALACFDAAIGIAPDYADGLYNRGVILHALGRVSEAIPSYDLAIAARPGHAEAWGNRGVALEALGHLREALESFDRAIAARPNYAEAHNNRGNILQRLIGPAVALESYERALQLHPAYPEAWWNRGNAFVALQRFQEALGSYERAVAARPDYAEAWANRGVALRGLGRNDDALASYDRAVSLKPAYPEAWSNRGVTLRELGRPADALDSYDRALAIHPTYAEVWSNRGVVLRDLERLDDALVSYDRAIAIRAEYAEVWNNRSATLHALHRYDEALENCDRSIAINPAYAEAWCNRGRTLEALGRSEAALESCDRSIALNPKGADAWNNRAVTMLATGRPAEALESCDRALAVKPDHVGALSNRGSALRSLGRLDEARESYERALAIEPGHPEVRLNVSLLDLQTGNLLEGWKGYEARWEAESAGVTQRDFAQPRWYGDRPLARRTILLHGEQGLGDALQFCRYAKSISDMGAEVVLEVERPLAGLMASLDGVARVIAQGDPLPPFDLHCPLLGLPLALKTEIDAIPSAERYLTADPGKVAAWAAALGPKTMPRIGLAWSGNPIHRNDRNRSIPLDTLLSGLPGGFQYVSLQKDVRNGDASTLADRPDILHFGDRLGDFSDTAALCALMDVVIAVDTSIAHLAGALGVPLWLLLPFMPDWRWLLDRDDSPWYPSARLFRQAAIGDWPSALAKVAAALTERFPDAASDERHNHAGALVNSGMLALQADDAAQALSLFGAALAADGNEAAAHCGRGNALHKLDRLEEALASYDRAIAIRPDYADAFNNRAFTLHRLDRFDAALADCDRAIALKPDYADAHSNRGMALAALGRLDEAVESYDQAIAAKPDLAEAHYNRALALQNLKRLDQARAGFQRAIAIRPGYVDALWNLSLIDLMTGNFADGWKGYERRWANAKLGHETRDFGRPLWQGERPIKGKTILLHAEQGLGDTIQFCRYAKPVAALGATVVLEAQPSLVPLLKSLNGPAQIIAKGDALPPLDLHCPLLSLPLAFDTDLGTIPAETPYLHPDDDRVAQWNRTLEGFGRPRIGLAWSGNPAHWNDGNRSIPLATLLSGLPQGFQYVSLQKDVLPGDAALLAKRTDVLHFGDRLGDFADTTALCQAMDVVISVDTSIAHLAGALGKEVWVLLPFVADWRWLLDRDDSPWYPTAHLFRQAAIGDWTGVMEHVREELGARPAPR